MLRASPQITFAVAHHSLHAPSVALSRQWWWWCFRLKVDIWWHKFNITGQPHAAQNLVAAKHMLWFYLQNGS